MHSDNPTSAPDCKAWFTEIEHLSRDIKALALKIQPHVEPEQATDERLVVAEILACLYGQYFRHSSDNSNWQDQDRLVLNKKHAGSALYATLILKGYFDQQELPENTPLPAGIEMTTGSLGLALSDTASMIMGSNSRIFAIADDEGLKEELSWEFFELAAYYKLNNLTLFVDHDKQLSDQQLNHFQRPFGLQDKFEVLGFNALSFEFTSSFGDDEYPSVLHLCNAIEHSLLCNDQPTVVIVNS